MTDPEPSFVALLHADDDTDPFDGPGRGSNREGTGNPGTGDNWRGDRRGPGFNSDLKVIL